MSYVSLSPVEGFSVPPVILSLHTTLSLVEGRPDQTESCDLAAILNVEPLMRSLYVAGIFFCND